MSETIAVCAEAWGRGEVIPARAPITGSVFVVAIDVYFVEGERVPACRAGDVINSVGPREDAVRAEDVSVMRSGLAEKSLKG